MLAHGCTTTSQNVLKKGYLWRIINTANNNKHAWKRHYLVVYDLSGNEKESLVGARLDWYPSESAYAESLSMRHGLFLEELQDLYGPEDTFRLYGDILPDKSMQTIFSLTYNWNDKYMVFGGESKEEVDEWMKCLNDLRMRMRLHSHRQRTAVVPRDRFNEIYSSNSPTEGGVFEVEIEDTAAATRCEIYGRYKLKLTNQHVCLIDPKTGKTVLSWLYSHIRRCGYHRNSLQLETGKRSAPADGLFIFKSADGDAIRLEMTRRMEIFKQTNPRASGGEQQQQPDTTGDEQCNSGGNQMIYYVNSSQPNPWVTSGISSSTRPGSKPKTGPGVSSGLNTMDMLSSGPGSKPGSHPGTKLEPNFETKLGSHLGKKPGSSLGTKPGPNSGYKPGSNPDIKCVSSPGGISSRHSRDTVGVIDEATGTQGIGQNVLNDVIQRASHNITYDCVTGDARVFVDERVLKEGENKDTPLYSKPQKVDKLKASTVESNRCSGEAGKHPPAIAKKPLRVVQMADEESRNSVKAEGRSTVCSLVDQSGHETRQEHISSILQECAGVGEEESHDYAEPCRVGVGQLGTSVNEALIAHEVNEAGQVETRNHSDLLPEGVGVTEGQISNDSAAKPCNSVVRQEHTRQSSAGAAELSKTILKMSEIVQLVPKSFSHSSRSPRVVHTEEDAVYSELDIRMDGKKDKLGDAGRDGHLYGPSLVYQLKKQPRQNGGVKQQGKTSQQSLVADECPYEEVK